MLSLFLTTAVMYFCHTNLDIGNLFTNVQENTELIEDIAKPLLNTISHFVKCLEDLSKEDIRRLVSCYILYAFAKFKK